MPDRWPVLLDTELLAALRGAALERGLDATADADLVEGILRQWLEREEGTRAAAAELRSLLERRAAETGPPPETTQLVLDDVRQRKRSPRDPAKPDADPS